MNILQTSYKHLKYFLQISYELLMNILQTSHKLIMNFLKILYQVPYAEYLFAEWRDYYCYSECVLDVIKLSAVKSSVVVPIILIVSLL